MSLYLVYLTWYTLHLHTDRFSIICSDYPPSISRRDQLRHDDPANAILYHDKQSSLPLQLGGKRTEEGLQKHATAGLHVW